ncbi:phosphoenolpyruvate hydrolase family protein [Billgrantia kenyensis]|uniref:Phosphoenolpyruvate hydrolase family protein n=1 Tax=Billgrantia kenyensis TaxID=321266 RepID=A0A7V9VYV2_9GAMM|nr:phosphoenolpyruvate hydrolase family protein [Halomonas kenyensis]MBA2777916.1 phosphoenolpyruvate hydrolase family protein [Halomonas kenyensis]MCG6661387.1 hypothetical protein [Halomonas kenyensis]
MTPAIAGHLVGSLEAAWAHGGTPSLLSPFTARLPASLADLAGSLPIGDANGELLASTRGETPFPEHAFAGVLATDPFRLADDLLDMLSRRGCRGVANWPSSALLGGTMGEALSHSKLGHDEEMAFLALAGERGFRTLAVIASEAQLAAALPARPSQLLVAVSVSVSKNPATAGAMVERLLEKVREAGYAPWLYEHAGVKALLEPLQTRAEVILRHPGPGEV